MCIKSATNLPVNSLTSAFVSCVVKHNTKRPKIIIHFVDLVCAVVVSKTPWTPPLVVDHPMLALYQKSFLLFSTL